MVSVREYKPGDFKKQSTVEWYDNMLQLRPNDTGLLYARGATLAKMGEHENALLSFERLTSLDSGHIKGWEAKAKTLLNIGRYHEALNCFDKLIELDRQDERFWFGKGEVLFKLERFREALECYNYAIELDQNYTDAWCGKGNALRAMKQSKGLRKPQKKPETKKKLSEVVDKVENLDEALRCFVEVLKRDPRHARALEGKGLVLCEMGKVDEGIGDLDRAVKEDPNRVEALYKKGKMLNGMGKKKEAQHTFTKIMEAPFSYNVTYDPDCWVAKGLASYELQRFDDSLEFYNKALVISPEDSRAWYGKGDALTKLGKYTEAINCYENAINVRPKNEQAWFGKATALRFSGKVDEALESYNKAIDINSRYLEAWYDKGTLLTVVKRFSEALECFVRVLDIDPRHQGAKDKKKEVEKRLKKSRKEEKKVVEESTENLVKKAQMSFDSGRYKEALKMCNEVLKRDRKNYAFWDLKAKVLTKMGRYTESMSCHENAVKLKHKSKPLMAENRTNEVTGIKKLIPVKIIKTKLPRKRHPIPPTGKFATDQIIEDEDLHERMSISAGMRSIPKKEVDSTEAIQGGKTVESESMILPSDFLSTIGVNDDDEGHGKRTTMPVDEINGDKNVTKYIVEPVNGNRKVRIKKKRLVRKVIRPLPTTKLEEVKDVQKVETQEPKALLTKETSAPVEKIIDNENVQDAVIQKKKSVKTVNKSVQSLEAKKKRMEKIGILRQMLNGIAKRFSGAKKGKKKNKDKKVRVKIKQPSEVSSGHSGLDHVEGVTDLRKVELLNRNPPDMAFKSLKSLNFKSVKEILEAKMPEPEPSVLIYGQILEEKPVQWNDVEKKLKSEDLDSTDRKIIKALLHERKPVNEVCHCSNIPIAVGYSRFLRLKKIGAIVCVGKVKTNDNVGERKLYTCTEAGTSLARDMGIETEKEIESILSSI